MDKKEWLKQAQEIINGYLTRKDGCFDDQMHASLVDCNYEEQSATIEFETQKWQINEWGGIHGGALAGMFDTAFGVMADFVAGEGEATTVDMNISYLRTVDFGQHLTIKVSVVKAGRKIIRQRAEMFCKETGKLVATGVGTWMPL